MFETLEYAGRTRVSARQIWALSLAAAVQVSVGVTCTLYSLFAAENLQPPSAWIIALPSIPVTLQGGPPRPPEPPRGPKAPPAQGFVSPNTDDLPPANLVPDGSSQIQTTGTYGTGPTIEGVPPGGNGNGEPTFVLTPEAPRTMNVWEIVSAPRPVKQVQPIYPAPALAMGLEGKVILQVTVNEEGRVVDVQVTSSTNSLFNRAAEDAVSQWQYTRPIAKANGQAVACYMTVVVTFQRK